MNSGYTLLEMLISIFILSIIILLLAFNYASQSESSKLSSTLLQLQTILESARSCALATGDEAIITFSDSVVTVDCDEHLSYEFTGIVITTNFPNDTGKFYASGVISQGATIEVCVPKRCKQLTIAVGRSDVTIK